MGEQQSSRVSNSEGVGGRGEEEKNQGRDSSVVSGAAVGAGDGDGEFAPGDAIARSSSASIDSCLSVDGSSTSPGTAAAEASEAAAVPDTEALPAALALALALLPAAWSRASFCSAASRALVCAMAYSSLRNSSSRSRPRKNDSFSPSMLKAVREVMRESGVRRKSNERGSRLND